MSSLRARIRTSLLALVVLGCVPTATPTATPAGPTVTPATATPTASGSTEPGTSEPTSTPLAEVEWVRQSSSDDLPEARLGHSWTVDPSDAAAYLVGGNDRRATFGDLWRYDLGADAWEQLRPAGPVPAPRTGHAAVWSDDLGVIVFGGSASDGTALDDLWAYAPSAGTWRELAPEGTRPPARSSTCAAAGPDGRIWVSHGFADDGSPLADTWIFDPEADRWLTAAPGAPGPTARGAHGCWWAGDGRLALYGGRAGDGRASAESWVLDEAGEAGAAWSNAETGPDPIARSDFALVRYNDVIVIHGGRDDDGAPTADVMTFDPLRLSRVAYARPADAPEARTLSAIADDPAGERLLMFGGETLVGASDEFWRLVLP